MQPKCPVCRMKKSRFVKEQEGKGLLSILGIKTLLSKNSIVKCFVLMVKMNEIVNNFLLAGDKFMPEMHLKLHGVTYSACGPLEIQFLFVTINLIRLVFNTIWFIANQKIYQKEPNQITF